MQLFESNYKAVDVAKRVKLNKDTKTCIKCNREAINYVQYNSDGYMCMDCYCELIAKDRRY